MNVGGILSRIFNVTCGVLQGCPMSGTLFVLPIDPLLTQFERYILQPGLGAVYARADDVGAAINSLDTLELLHRLFEAYRKAIGLTLKTCQMQFNSHRECVQFEEYLCY